MADRIEQQIDKVTSSIERLTTRINNLQNQLTEGGLGTDQVKRLQAEVDRLNASLARKESKKVALVDKRDTQELDRLNKAIDTLQRKLDGLRAKQKDADFRLLPQDPATFKRVNDEIIREIQKAERALASFESRRSKRFDPVSGHKLTDEQVKQREAPIDVIPADPQEAQRFLNQRIIGIPLTNAEIQAQVAQARRLALNILEGRTRMGDYRPAGEPVIAGGHPDQPGYGQPGLGSDIGYESKEERAKRVASERAAKAKERQADREEREYVRAEQAAKKADAAREREARANERAAKAAEQRARDEERIADARRLLVSDPRYQNALNQARQRGFGPDDLRNIEDRGGNVQRLRFAQQRGGVNAQFNPYVNLLTGGSTPGTSSQFRTFGSDILRDIGQFTKWSIAVAAVYTPLAKLNELMQIMVENESRLADATIAANIPFERSGEIFDAVAEAANQSGESITGVIDAYAQAFRAAGRYSDESEKAAKATQLLNDSLILSKLSSLDQATSIDTLTAALLQAELELDQGEQLLNKWVRVSQIANVTIDGLAVGVAVLGDSAETAGLGVDKLNGLIAVLSEQSISGSREAANTAKALIGAYQSDKAEAALNRYGIALRNANGEVRDFLDIYQEVASLRQQGLISEAGISELSLALGGGGVRRAKDAAALINSTERLNELAAESAAITGDSTLAQDSLAKKLQTVETATTRLSNAWQELAETLGDDGGLLDLFKGMLNALTGITSAADDLFTLLGRSGPILATFTTALLALKALPEGTRATFLTRIGPQALTPEMAIRQQAYNPVGAAGQYGRGILADILQLNRRGGTILGGASVIGSGLSNLQAGRNENAVANVIGGLIGGAIGATLGGGIGIAAGAAIGSSVADSFVTGLLSHDQDLASYFAGLIPTPDAAAPGGQAVGREQTTEELIRQTYKDIGGGVELFGEARAYIEYLRSQIKAGGGVVTQAPGGFATPEAAALELLKRANPAVYAQLQARRDTEVRQEVPLTTGQDYLNLQRMAERERQRQLERVSTGDLRPAEFGKISERLTGFPTTALREVEAFGQAFIALSRDVDNTAEAYQAFLELTVNGTEEQQSQLNSYVSDIIKLQEQWEAWQPGTKDLTLELTTGARTFQTREAVKEAMNEAQRQAAQFAVAGITNARLQQLSLPNIVGSATEATSASDVELIRREAERIQNQFYQDMGLTIDQIDFLRKGLEDFTVLVERAGENHFDTISGIDQKFWDAAQKLLIEQGKLQDKQGFGLQQFDVDRATLERLAAQSVTIGQNWAQEFPGFETKPEDLLAITNEGLAKPIHADFRILALLLEKIIDQNQKQLDGQYNIPEGATFWVPLTAAYYRRQAGSDGLGSMLDSLAVDSNTSATDENTRALREAAVAFRGDPGYSRAAEAARAGAGLKERDPQVERFRHATNRYPLNAIGGRLLSDAVGIRKSEDLLPPRPTAQGAQTQSFLDQLKNFFRSIFTLPTGQIPAQGPGARGFGGGAAGSAAGGSRFAANAGQVNTNPTARLDLRISSNTNLLVDGRVLAQSLQTHLASELLRTEQSQGTITKRYII